jgi:hypothetical protein
MKVIVVLFLAWVASLSCHKSTMSAGDGCERLVHGQDTVSVCFQEIISESWCPPGAQCLVAGYTLASFQFTKNHISYPIQLATATIANTCSKDTTLEGYRVELLELSRNSGTNEPPTVRLQITLQ